MLKILEIAEISKKNICGSSNKILASGRFPVPLEYQREYWTFM
jgi:hypothetical protein